MLERHSSPSLTWLFPTLTFTFALLTLAIQPALGQGGHALDFNGSSSYVESPYSATLNPSNFTVEAWAKVEGGSGTFRSVITSRRAGSPTQGFMLYAASDNTWQFWTGDGGNSTWDVTSSGVTVADDWTHIAASFDGTSVRLYINGELRATTACVYIPNSTRPMRIGAGATEGTPDFYFNGKIDEVRIWSSVRTLSQIQANMHKSLTGSESNLVAYYSMSNGSGTSLTDNSTNTNDGTLTNSPAWIVSGAHAGPGMALDFDGTNDYVDLGSNAAFRPTSALTLELWANHANSTWTSAEDYSAMAGNTQVGGYELITYHSGRANLEFWIRVNGAYSTVEYPLANLGTGWHHFAATFDGRYIRLYVDGNLVDTNDLGSSGIPVEYSVSNSFLLGAEAGTAATPTGNYFPGQLDEFRLWNVARTEAEIRATMYRTLEGNESNLVAYYRFDQQPNSSHTTLHNQVSNSLHGTLTNMAPASDWVSSAPFNTWIGSESGVWTNAENWSRGSVPSTEDIGIFPWSAYNAPASGNISARNCYVATGTTVSHSGNLTLSGEFHNAGTFTTSGTVTFSGTSAQAIRGSGTTTFGTLTLNNDKGVTMEQNLTLTSTLTLTSGALSIGANTLTLNGSLSQTSGSLTGGSSSNLTVGGSGSALSIPALTLNNLTLNRSNGASLSGAVTVGGTLTLTSGALSIGANTLTLNGSISQTSGSLTGGGTSNISIGGSGAALSLPAVTLNNLSLNRSNGAALTGEVTVGGTLTLTSGVLNVGANMLTLGNSASIAGTPGASAHVRATSGTLRKNYPSTGSFLFPVGDGTNYSPITLNFTSGSFSSGSATVSVTNAKHPNNSSASHFLNRYWSVSSSGITGFSCNVSALYVNADINGTETLLTGAKYSAGEWLDLGAVTPASNLITGTVSGFSDFTAGESAAFPVEWLDFAATRQGGGVRLNWATASEVNNDYFAVERSADREYWSDLGEVGAMGNGHAVQTYRFDDLQPLAGKAWYRLRQVDLDGGVSYSQVVEVSEGVQGGLKTWPNPVQDQLHFALNSAEQVTATLTDLSGRVVWQQTLPSGSATVAVDQLPAGVYFLRVRGEAGVLAEQKMMKE